MNVLHIITTIEKGGAENQLKVLVARQIDQGINVDILPLKGKLELLNELRSLGATVNTTIHNKSVVFQIMRLLIMMTKKSVILHAHLPRAEILGALCKLRNPIVVSKHNAEAFFPGKNKYLSRSLSRFVERQSSQVICISIAVRDFLVGTGELTDPTKQIIVYYGLPSGLGIQRRNQVFRDSDLHFTVGCVARLVEQKNISTLLHAFQRFHLQIPHSNLVVIGEGNLKDSLIKEAHDLDIESAVTWMGRHPSPLEVMSCFDVMVLPSLYEGFGMVLLEAMLLEVPIIAARNSAIPEVLGINYMGLFDTLDTGDLHNKLMHFFGNDVRLEARQQLSERLPKFNSEVMADSVLNVYQKLQSTD